MSSSPPPAGMWMPGAPKPSSPSINHKRPRVEPQQTAQLSGATRNMRFMQRNTTATAQRQQQQQPQPVDRQPQTQTQQPMDTTTDTDTSNRGVTDDSVASATAIATQTALGDVPPRATPLEMYGKEQSMVLGRRSFGGFNKVTAENWYAQQQEEGYQQKKKSKPTQAAISDEELVRRYKDLAQGRNINDGKQRRNNSNNNNNKRAKSISNSGKKKR